MYGADAVTGVVNFILNDEFDGLIIKARTGLSEYGDAGQSALSAVYGLNSSDQRSNVTFAVDVRK